MLVHKGDNLNFLLMLFSEVQKNVAPAWLTNRLIYGFDHLKMFITKLKKKKKKRS